MGKLLVFFRLCMDMILFIQYLFIELAENISYVSAMLHNNTYVSNCAAIHCNTTYMGNHVFNWYDLLN